MRVINLSETNYLKTLGTKLGILGLSLLAIAPAPLRAQSPTPQTVRYTCEQGRSFETTFSSGSAQLRLDTRQTYTLPQVASASGARYVSGNIALYTKDNQAFLTLDRQQPYRNCSGQRAQSGNQPSPSAPNEPTPPQQPSSPPAGLNFERYGCGRFPQEAYYRTQTHFVNICQGPTGLLMVVTDNDGLARQRLAATRRGSALYDAVSDQGTVYSIDRSTFTISVQGQAAVQERVERGSASGSPQTVVTGTVNYRQRIALPPNAVVDVRLLDVSRVDAAATPIARQTINSQGRQVPIPFSLPYNPAEINPNGSYAVQVRISVDGRLRWITTSRYAVITQGNPTQIQVWVDPVD